MENDVRLIDANALNFQYAHMIYPNGTESLGYTAYVTSVQVKDAPTIDAVPVVRCKDCIYATAKDGDLYCDGPIGIFGTVGFNDFCSYGERKDDGICKEN